MIDDNTFGGILAFLTIVSGTCAGIALIRRCRDKSERARWSVFHRSRGPSVCAPAQEKSERKLPLRISITPAMASTTDVVTTASTTATVATTAVTTSATTEAKTKTKTVPSTVATTAEVTPATTTATIAATVSVPTTTEAAATTSALRQSVTASSNTAIRSRHTSVFKTHWSNRDSEVKSAPGTPPRQGSKSNIPRVNQQLSKSALRLRSSREEDEGDVFHATVSKIDLALPPPIHHDDDDDEDYAVDEMEDQNKVPLEGPLPPIMEDTSKESGNSEESPEPPSEPPQSSQPPPSTSTSSDAKKSDK